MDVDLLQSMNLTPLEPVRELLNAKVSEFVPGTRQTLEPDAGTVQKAGKPTRKVEVAFVRDQRERAQGRRERVEDGSLSVRAELVLVHEKCVQQQH